MPIDRKDELIVAMGDRTLKLAASNEKLADRLERIDERLNKAIDAFLAVKRIVSDAVIEVDEHMREIRQALGIQGERVAVVKHQIDDLSGPFRTMARSELDKPPHPVVGVLREFRAMPWGTQLLFALLLLAVTGGGWIKYILHLLK